MAKVMNSEKFFLQMMEKDCKHQEKSFNKQVKNVIDQRLEKLSKDNTK